ncbi:MAG: DUF4390 domain-containing protein [Gammaproteobacteria bacterium]
MSRRAALAFLLALLLAEPAAASDITISGARSAIDNGILMLDADAAFEFSDDALEAIESGIVLYFDLDIRIRRPRRYMWDSTVFTTRRRYAIERHALSDQYVLTDTVTGTRRSHPSLAAAIEDLGRLRQVPVLEATELDAGTDYDLGIRLRLDIESLPAPMVPLAYLSPGWRMSSGWHRWLAER